MVFKSNHEKIDFELLFQSAPDLYLILDTNFVVVAATDAYLKATMQSRNEVLGKNIFAIFPDNPNDFNKGSINVRASLERVLETKAADTLAVQKYDIRSPNGDYEIRYWSPINIPILENDEVKYILHRVEDVTAFINTTNAAQSNHETIQQKKQLQTLERDIVRRAQEIQEANKRLRESEERLRLMLEATKDYSIIMLDPDGNIKTWNAGAQNIQGYDADEIIGKHFSIFYTEKDKERNHPQFELEQAIKLGRYEEEGWRIRKNNNLFCANVIITPIYDEKNHLIGFGKVTRDLTESKKIEKLKNEFVSVVSHELRTPLTSIRGSISLVLGGVAGELAEKSKNLLTIANNNCERLVKLINDILDIEKIEEGKMTFKFSNFKLNYLINESLTINEIYAEKYNIRLIPRNILDNILVNVDSDRLMQVLTNLISNAVKFSPRGGAVVISTEKIGDLVRIAISDSGPGIPEEFKDKIFQKFSQADSSSTRREGGTGLGLAISKIIVERLGGNLKFESEIGKGTTFYFDLPIISNIKINETPGHEREAKSVLICEDDKDQASFIASLLSSAGYKADIAYTGEEAKKLLTKNKYDALLLDLILPDINGIKLIRELRVEQKNPIPIIVLSAMANEGRSLINGSAVEVIDWLEKPIDFTKLSRAFSLIRQQENTDKFSILHIEDDKNVQAMVKQLVEEKSEIVTASTLKEAQEKLNLKNYDLVILDLLLPDGNGAELLTVIGEKNLPVIIFTQGDLDPKYAHYVKDVLNKARTSSKKLLETILKYTD